mgnify:CR=1 FL=1
MKHKHKHKHKHKNKELIRGHTGRHENPLISVVTVVYNSEKYIERTINSVLNQTYDNIEYIVIDGGSSDGTVDIIRRYESFIDCWVTEKDSGIYNAMNKGISLCTGSFIGLINSGDSYVPNAIEEAVKYIRLMPTLDILFGDMYVVDEFSGLKRYASAKIERISEDMSINHPTCFVKRDIYCNKRFDEIFQVAADYEFVLYNYLEKKNFFNMGMVVANMNRGGFSSNNPLTIKERFVIHEKYYSKSHAYINWLKCLTKIFVRDLLSKLLPVCVMDYIKGYRR